MVVVALDRRAAAAAERAGQLPYRQQVPQARRWPVTAGLPLVTARSRLQHVQLQTRQPRHNITAGPARAAPGARMAHRSTDSPGDIPAERPAALGRLNALVGQWEMEVSFEAGYFGPGSAPVAGRGGRTTFHWLEGEFFLIQRFTVENPAAPSGILANWPVMATG